MRTHSPTRRQTRLSQARALSSHLEMPPELVPEGSSTIPAVTHTESHIQSNSQPSQHPDDPLLGIFADLQNLLPLPLTDPLGSLVGVNSIPPGFDHGGDGSVADAGRTAVSEICGFIDQLSRRLNLELSGESITSAFVDACLHEFLQQLLPRFPVIHRPTFSPRNCIPPLLLNIIALGSLFVCLPRAREKGEMLWRLAHTAVATSWQTLIGSKSAKDGFDSAQIVLTALLGQTYAYLSSDSSIRTTAFVFHGLGFLWARVRGMHTVDDCKWETLAADASDAEKQSLWETWAAKEVQRRAVLGHYILDGLLSQASGSPTSARHMTNRLTFAASDAAFAATNVGDWIRAMQETNRTDCSFSESFHRICSSQYCLTPLQLSPFSVMVILEGLQSLIAELSEVDQAGVGIVSRQEVVRGLMNLYQANITTIPTTTETHVQLLIQWHAVCIEASVSSAGLYYALCKHFDLPQQIAGMRAEAAGSQIDIEAWCASSSAFRSLLHADGINKLLKDVTISNICMIHFPSAIFSSAVVYATLCIFRQDVIRFPKSWVWHDIWKPVLDGTAPQEKHLPADGGYLGQGFANGDNVSSLENVLQPIELLHEINFLQLTLKMIGSRWGVAEQMASAVSRFAALAQERYDLGVYPNFVHL